MFVVDVADSPVPVRSRSTKRRVNWNDGERGCDSCPLQENWDQLKTPRMPLHGPAKPDILILGEAPGEDEDKGGVPFVGRSGELLRRLLPHRERDRFAMTNAARCRPPGNRNPTGRELHCCSTYLEDDIANGNFKAILGLGNVPLSRFMTEATITAVHGLKFPVKIGEKVLWYYPTLHPAFVLRGDRDDRSPSLPILQNDIAQFFKRIDKWKKPVIEEVRTDSVVLAYTEDIARVVCDKMLKAGKPVGFDLETNDLRPNATGADIMTAAVSNGSVTVAWPVHHPQAPNDWGLNLLFEMTRRLRWIAHHAGFELAWLLEHSRRHNIAWEPAAGYDDSMVAARLYQRRETCLNLGVLTRLYLGTNIKTLSDIDTARIAEASLSDVLPYNGLDAWGSWRIYQLLAPHVDTDNYDSILATIESVTEMQLAGLDVDQIAAQELRQEWQGRASAAQAHAKTVYEVKQFERQRQAEFNIASTEHVAAALIEHGGVKLPTTAGSDKEGAKQRFSTDDTTLSKLDNPLAADVLAYRHAKKMDSTYVEPMLQAPTRFVDGRLHPVYSTVLTKTLRLSCEDPNAQNFPKRKDRELRRAVVPPAGCVWASADYGQLEARVYGMASRDRALCDSLIAEEDIHSHWLNIILREYPPYMERLATKVTPNDTDAQIRKGGRDIVKSDFVFASFFGSTAKNVAERADIPIDIATDILAMFWDRYAGAYQWLKAKRRDYFTTGTASNLCGFERYGVMNGNEPVNLPIQSTAARLVLEAQNEMCQLSKQRSDPYLLPRINIHDDITFALPDDDARLVEYIEEISEVLTRVRFRWQIVPLKVEWKIGPNWAELHDVFNFTGGLAAVIDWTKCAVCGKPLAYLRKLTFSMDEIVWLVRQYDCVACNTIHYRRYVDDPEIDFLPPDEDGEPMGPPP